MRMLREHKMRVDSHRNYWKNKGMKGKKKTKDKLKLLFKAEIAQSMCKFSGFIV